MGVVCGGFGGRGGLTGTSYGSRRAPRVALRAVLDALARVALRAVLDALRAWKGLSPVATQAIGQRRVGPEWIGGSASVE